MWDGFEDETIERSWEPPKEKKVIAKHIDTENSDIAKNVENLYASTSYTVEADYGFARFMSNLKNIFHKDSNITIAVAGNPQQYWPEEIIKEAYMAGIKYMEDVQLKSETTLRLSVNDFNTPVNPTN